MKKISIIIITFAILLVACSTKNGENNSSIQEIEKLKNENIKLISENKELIAKIAVNTETTESTFINEENEFVSDLEDKTDEIEYYYSGDGTQFIGYCYYTGINLPKIYPSDSADEMSSNSGLLPSTDKFIVEVIRSLSNGWYLVRIPFCENYVFVKPNELIQIYESDYPKIKLSDFTLNGIRIGQDINKLLATYNGQSFLSFDFYGGMDYVLYNITNNKRELISEAVVGVDTFNRILTAHISTDQIILDDKLTVGDTLQEVVDFYDEKYPRFIFPETNRRNNYIGYETDSYLLLFYFEQEDPSTEALIFSIVISDKEYSEY